MLYDLNIPWSTNQDPTELQRTISFLSELGYDTIALNHTLNGVLAPQISNPIPSSLPFTIPAKTVILRRCTLTISDPSLNHRLSALAPAYDILALRPTTEKAYLAATQTLTEHSLISLDLAQRFPFHFKPKPLMTAINRGCRIEICYAQATMEDSAARRNFISNCISIVRATRGRGLVISSEARSVLALRAPADVLNLLGVWGLARERGLESMGVNPRGVVVNEGMKRRSFRGVIDVVDGGESQFVREKKDAEKPTSTPVNGISKKGKRKAPEPTPDTTSSPALSKRAAKKAKYLAKQASSGIAPEPDSSSNVTPSQTPIPSSDTPSKPQAKASG